jgi:hypothetical protein
VGAVWTATGRERPVFLDERGRRRRFVHAGGALAGAIGAFWLAVLATGAIGFFNLPSLRVPPRPSGSWLHAGTVHLTLAHTLGRHARVAASTRVSRAQRSALLVSGSADGASARHATTG